MIELRRYKYTNNYITGQLFIDNEYFCETLELPYKSNKPFISCIPLGTYNCIPHNGNKYKGVVKLLNVKDRANILIHSGNKPKDTKGCILVGEKYKEGYIKNSKKTLQKLFTIVGKKFNINIIKIENNMAILTIAGGMIGKQIVKKLAIKAFDKIKGRAKKKALEKLSSFVSSKLNIKTSEDIGNITQEQISEIHNQSEQIVLEIQKEYTKQTDIINKTMQRELQSDNVMQRTWRPFVGYCFGFSASLLITTISIMLIISVFKGPNIINNLTSTLTSLSGIVTIIFGAMGGVCGVVGYGRSQEKMKGKD